MLKTPTTNLKTLKLEFRELCSTLYIKQINSLFSSAGFIISNNNPSLDGTRRGCVDAFYESADWSNEETVKNFFKVIEFTLHQSYLSDETKDCLRNFCRDNGFDVEDNKIICKDLVSDSDLFIYQFPAGLPFGVPKPSFSITALKGSQTLKYEIKDGIGLLKGKIYPNFSFKMLEMLCNVNSSTNAALKRSLRDMNQSEYEKDFFLAYATKFDMASQDIPVLIPQAWIQWHSQTKKNLRDTGSTHADELYRADFVAFWNNKRYIILVDDIKHYAIQKGVRWDANEESYAKRLKEDRKLQNENWHVFRVSNWELRDKEKVEAILEDLRDFIGFYFDRTS